MLQSGQIMVQTTFERHEGVRIDSFTFVPTCTITEKQTLLGHYFAGCRTYGWAIPQNYGLWTAVRRSSFAPRLNLAVCRNAVKLGIRILDPKPGDKCIDPACGTGGFVVVIMNYISERLKQQMIAKGKDPAGKDLARYNLKLRLASQRIFGIDINPNLVRVARMNMVMNNDGQGVITHLNSLDRPEAWRFAPGDHRFYQEDGSIAKEDIEEYFRRELVEGTFDICATNPPFGTKIKIEGSLLSQYELAHKWSYNKDRKMWSPTPVLQTGVAPEILFIERCVRLLKPGTGKLCIVLPDGQGLRMKNACEDLAHVLVVPCGYFSSSAQAVP
jgi:hypothetical protein